MILYFRSAIADGVKLLKNVGDNIILILLHKDYFGLEKDVIIAFCYVVPDGSSRSDISDINIFDEIIATMAQYTIENDNNVSFMICGDLNARTATEADYVINYNNMYLPLSDD